MDLQKSTLTISASGVISHSTLPATATWENVSVNETYYHTLSTLPAIKSSLVTEAACSLGLPEGEVLGLAGERAQRLGEDLGQHVQPLLHQVRTAATAKQTYRDTKL